MSALSLLDRNSEIVAALESGELKAQVAQRFGISERQVYTVGKAAGWKGRGGGARKSNAGPTDLEQRSQAWHDAQQAYLRSLIAELPDPAEFAAALTVDQIAALLTARWDKHEPGWYVMPDAAKVLRPAGLCEAGKTYSRYFLGGFGIKVLKEIRKDVA